MRPSLLDQLTSLDVSVFQAINLGFPSPFVDHLMRFLSSAIPWSIAAVVLAIYSYVKKKRQLLISCLIAGAAVGLTDFVTYRLLKPNFGRNRPCHQRIDYRLVQNSCGGDFGFPSNHAANGAAIVAVLAWRHRRAGFWSTGPAVLAVGFSRIYLGAHFPGDVLFGYAVGGSLGAGIAATAQHLIARKNLMSKSPSH